MKKIISLIIILALIFTAIPALPPSAVDTAYAETSGYTVAKNGIVTYTAADGRAAAVERIFQMSDVDWELSVPLTYNYKVSGLSATLPAGKYKGIPYVQEYRDCPDPEDVQANMDAVVLGTGPVKGLNCSASGTYALRYATGNDQPDNTFLMEDGSAYITVSFLYDAMTDTPGTGTTSAGIEFMYRDNLDKVGWYGNYTDFATAGSTNGILANLKAEGNYVSGTVYENVYAKMKPSDLLVRFTTSNSAHVMMVERVSLVYENNTINPKKSKAYVIDIGTPNHLKSYNGIYTSWRNDNVGGNDLTLEYLANKQYYLPVTAFRTTENYPISYDSDGGSIPPESQIKEQNAPLQVSSEIPTKTGYVFAGWTPVSNPANIIIPAGGYYLDEQADTLKAQWTPNTGNVVFNANGGTNAPSSQIKSYGIDLTLTDQTPTRKGYAFMGWSKSKKATKPGYTAGGIYNYDANLKEGSGSSVTLYAVWKKHIDTNTITLSKTSSIYTGKSLKKPSVTVMKGTTKLVKGTDYTVTYPKTIKAVGKYGITITGMGKYGGSKTLYYYVYPKAPSAAKTRLVGYDDVKFSWKASTGATGYYVYYRNATKSTYKLLGTTTETNYTKSNLSDGSKYYFRVVPYFQPGSKKYKSPEGITKSAQALKKVSIVAAWTSGSKVTIQWANIPGESGYQISQSKSKKGTNIVATYKTTKGTMKTLSAKKGTTYYYKVRAYKTIDGKRIYAPWSTAKEYRA